MSIKYHGPDLGDAGVPLSTLAWSNPGAPNPGLLFQRFMGLSTKPASRSDVNEKNETKGAIDHFARRVNDLSEMREHEYLGRLMGWHRRMDHLSRRGETNGRRFHHCHADATMSSPLITGAGYAHPLQNALSFHHTLGVPYLPGSSLKGFVRTWWLTKTDQAAQFADQMGYPSRKDDNTLDASCGKRGEWVFMDALPIGQWPKLEADIINCHLPAYYGSLVGESSNPEAVLFENPIPAFIPAVAVKGLPSTRATSSKGKRPRALEFRFWVGVLDGDRSSAEQGMKQLMEALDWLGAGAKTAVGYGASRVPKRYRSS